MKTFAPDRIRNVVLVGHGGSGKTTLAEALLYRAGAVNRRGRVEDGSTVCDFDEEEKKRGFSLSLALAPFEWKGHKINLLDTPGYADFVGDVAAALRVADLAVFVVSAVEGVEVQTELIWRMAEERGVPRMVFVNKLDRERAGFERTLGQLREVFGQGVAPLELPVGEEQSFHGVADLLTDRAYLYDSGQAQEADIPEEMADLEHQVRDNLVEGIVVADDGLLERYLEGEEISAAELEVTLAKGVAEASVFPVVCGSATGPIAVDRLADFVCEIGTPPTARPPVPVEAAGEQVEVSPDPDGQPLAFVFKSIADPYVGQVSLFKVLSGTVRNDDHLHNTRSDTDERLHGVFTLRGKEQLEVGELPAGDLGGVAKLNATHTGDTLAPRGTPVRLEPITFPDPVLAVAVRARNQAEEDKLANALHKVADEDPSIVVERSEETRQTLLRGVGETHLQITLEKLAKLGVDVETEDPKVPYRETITASADAEGKHKKQTGGRGQFAVAVLKVEPLERGSGFEFVDSIVGGAIPRQYIPAVQKGIEDAMAHGGVFGFPVVDVKVTCYDGKHHPVDSSEMAFQIAGSVGFKEALAKASPVVLEPVSHLEVVAPVDQQGDVMGDLNGRRGRVLGTEPTGDGREQVVVAEVPTSEVQRYAIDLRSLTGGRGRFTIRHSRYDVLPANLTERVAAAAAG